MSSSSRKNNLSVRNSFESLFGNPNSSVSGWSPPQEYPAQIRIISQDTPAKGVFFVESGLLKLSRIDSAGHEVIAGLRRRDWMLGAPAVLLGKKYSFTTTTIAPCSLRYIAAEKFLNLVETDKHFSRQMHNMLSQEIFTHAKDFVNLGGLPAKERLKRLLYELITEIAQSSDSEKQVKIHFPLKYWELAQMLAVTPEHMSRLLKALEHEGVIQRDGDGLTIKNANGLVAESEI